MSEVVPVLELKGVVRRYREGDGALEILSGVDGALWPGQAVALVAPSGAGESTLLHIAGLLERPDAGEIAIEGVATSGLDDAARTANRPTGSASSISSIIFCRSSPRWKMS